MKNKKLTAQNFTKLKLLGIHCDKIPNKNLSYGVDKSIVHLEVMINNDELCLLTLSSFGVNQGIQYADPEYMIEINKDDRTARALTFMNFYSRSQAYDNKGRLNKVVEEKICISLSEWLSELIGQVHSFAKSKMDLVV